MSPFALSVLLIVATFLGGAQGFQCGHQAGGAVCSQGACCSQWGYCGFTQEHCGSGCQSQCSGGATPSPPPPPPSPPSPPGGGGRNCSGGGVAEVVTEYLFNEMLLHRNDPRCPGRGFYTYEAFLCAAETFPEFGNKGDMDTRRREVAAFFGQTSHETTGGWPTAEDGPYAWGYCHVVEVGQTNAYCVPSTQWPCVPGKTYFGRGPIQLSYNYNYGPAGQYLGLDLLGDPDMVGTEAIVSFETALWFWMTAQPPKPSSHDVIIGAWTPSAADIAAGRFPGYGVITNIINGGLECGIGQDARVQSRIGFYKRYCDILGLSYGDNLDCSNQMPFG